MSRPVELPMTQQKRISRIGGCIGIILALVILLGATVVTTLAIAPRFIITSGPIVVLPDSSRVLLQIRDMGRLETVSYTLERVYTYDQHANSPWYDVGKYFGNQKKLFVVPGEVIAGVDLAQLKQDGVHTQGKAITLTLPSSQILETTLDEQNVQVYDISTGIYTFLPGMDPKTQDQILAAAKVSLHQDACDAGILQKAADNAKRQFTTFLTELGFTQVTITILAGAC